MERMKAMVASRPVSQGKDGKNKWLEKLLESIRKSEKT